MTLIAIHLLQNHAPSNLNRDDNGDPKDAIFGGTRRARISSQSLKRSIRRLNEFRDFFPKEQLASRTKKLPQLVGSILERYGDLTDEDRGKIVRQVERLGANVKDPVRTNEEADEGDDDSGKTKARGSNKGKKGADSEPSGGKGQTAQLIFFTSSEVEELATALYHLRGQTTKRNNKDIPFGEWTGDEVKDKVGRWLEPHAVDIAMFGRMTTSSPFKDIEASVQVAHALSTHTIEPEFDFFTAVDDRSTEPGAGMLGDVAFNSATYYKYINIHWEGLLANVNNERELAATTVQALLKGAMFAIPTGKQNSFAAHNLPDFALVEVLEKNIPISYANAFLKSVRAKGDSSLMEASIAALTSYAGPLPARFGLPVARAVFPVASAMDAALCADLAALTEWLTAHLPQTEQGQ